MTDKLYYIDPMQAYYMNREFRVKYSETPDGANELWWMIEDYYFYDDDETHFDKAYIHPDSLDIFKPMVGDVMIFDNDDMPYVVRDYDTDKTWLTGRIIQRNNLPFFPPKEES